jgi:hypothetical protein
MVVEKRGVDLVESRGGVPPLVEDFEGGRAFEITTLSEPLSSGFHSVEWRGLNSRKQPVSSGVYLCRMKAGGLEWTRRVTLLK